MKSIFYVLISLVAMYFIYGLIKDVSEVQIDKLLQQIQQQENDSGIYRP